MIKRIIFIAVVLMVTIIMSFCGRTRLPKDIMYALENPSPTATSVPMRTLKGQEIFSSLDLLTEETIVIVKIIWDVRCPYCKQELLYLQDVYADHPKVLLVGNNPYNTQKQIQEYVNENALFSIIMVTGWLDWFPPGVPFTSIYLRDGTLLNEFFGWNKEYSPDQLDEIIEGGLR